jgi:hypothetical protein
MKKILILNGPNLNMLGTREPEIYGRATLDDIKTLCEQKAKALGMRSISASRTMKATLVDWIQEAAKGKIFDGLIINAAAYTHTSIAIHDALRSALRSRASRFICRTRRSVKNSAAFPMSASSPSTSSPAIRKRAMRWRSKRYLPS